MPFALPALADLLWAVFGALLAAGGVLVARLLQDNIGRLPWVGWALRDAFQTVVVNVEDWVISRTAFAFSRIGSWMAGHGFIVFHLIASIANTLRHHGDQIAHLHNTTVPNAVNASASAINANIGALQSDLQAQLNADRVNEHRDVTALQSYVDGPYRASVNAAISSAQRGAIDQAHAQLAQAESDLVTRINDVVGTVNGLEQLTQVTIPQEIQTAMATAESVAHAELSASVSALDGQMSDINTRIDAAIAAEATALANARSAITAQESLNLSTAEGFAQSQALAVKAQSAAALAAASAATAATLTQERNSVQTQINTINARQQIDALNIGGLVQDTSIAIPLSIAAVAAGVAAITTEYNQCGVTTCDGPNNISNVVKHIVSGFETAGEIGFLASAIKDPEQTANVLAPILGTVTSGATGLLDLLLSL